jgi:hypothetical protein
MTDPTPTPVTFELLGGPTVIIRIGGLTLLTDPTFDAPGDYPAPSGPVPSKKDGRCPPAARRTRCRYGQETLSTPQRPGDAS